MKNSLACPKCESRKLWRIERIRHAWDGVPDKKTPVAVFLVEEESWVGSERHHSAGHYDAYVCHQCGYTEFWAQDFGDLAHLPDKGIHFIDTTPQQGQYR